MLAGKVGYVFQNPDDQIFKYNVLDEVMFGPLNIGMSQAEAKEKALKASGDDGTCPERKRRIPMIWRCMSEKWWPLHLWWLWIRMW